MFLCYNFTAVRILLIVVACASLVVYGEEPKAKTDAHRQDTAQAIQQTASAANGTIIVVNQREPEGQENNHPQKPPSYLSHLLAPENIPNIALVIAAIGGIIVAVYTLRGINKQAGLMDAQLNEMRQSREIETKTLLLQYRPKIIVRDARASDFNVAELGNPAQGKVRLTLVNTGGTPANILGGWIALWSAQASVSVPLEIKQGEEAQFSAFTLQPGERESLERELDTGTTNDIQWANFHQAIKTDPMRYIYLVGVLVYRDDLGIPRQTGIHRVYDPKTKTFTPGDFDGECAD